MKAIGIDFGQRRRRAPALLRPLLAACAAAAALLAGQAYWDHAAQRGAWQLLLDEAPPVAEQAAAADAAGDELAGKAKHLAGVHRALASPWEALFGAVEAVPAEGVALLGVSADADTRELLVSGEARDIRALHAYMQQLGKAPGLGAVHLASHELQAREGGQPVLRFSFMANWRAAAAAAPAEERR
ncbi:MULTISPECIES: PilN domain-containing protein [unclassified Janthinobacterium]|uniref:PilN domain-containing protein n=1 Tax=unclassified Janthinobacterium TaxID=2610881 RepID=UPI0003450F27|nr:MULTISPECIES: PilN domain-containing protein [unclassified Janthinobacterium]MEC5159554.1 Tfp pilus assembly protein PilN [Janthinobacterium sp. CG_S6]